MSKVGRKPINIDGVTLEVNGNSIHYKGPKASGTYVIPAGLHAHVSGNVLHVEVDKTVCASSKQLRDINGIWGLHRALLANAIKGATQDFENLLEINGLGYKAVAADKKIVFTLGYSHKIDVEIPKGITVEIDKVGQKIKVKSPDKELAGQFCSEIKALRMPDAYKGKGIKLSTEKLVLKSVGKAK